MPAPPPASPASPPPGGAAARPRTDCAHYRGDLPCRIRKVCWDCADWTPIGKRALVVKFGAPGDALRTTPVLERLRREGYGEITWICDAASREVLSMAPGIDRLVVHGQGALEIILTETFDVVLSLDKDPSARALAALSRSPDRRGFTATEAGRLETFDARSDYALRLGVDDDLKFRGNTQTVPEILFAMCGWTWGGERYAFAVPESAGADAENAVPSPRRVVLNLGCGPRWPTKAWPESSWIALARLLVADGLEPVFAGGPAERDLVARCANDAGVASRPPGPLAGFAQFVAASGALVTADSLALHVALAVNCPVIGLFCSTVDAEIAWYGNGLAIRGDGGPCYNPRCEHWPGCMEAIRPESVAAAVAAAGRLKKDGGDEERT